MGSKRVIALQTLSLFSETGKKHVWKLLEPAFNHLLIQSFDSCESRARAVAFILKPELTEHLRLQNFYQLIAPDTSLTEPTKGSSEKMYTTRDKRPMMTYAVLLKPFSSPPIPSSYQNKLDSLYTLDGPVLYRTPSPV